MYAGRNKGGYNIAELGTMGYEDKLSQRLAAETEADRRQGQVKVEFNFVQKEIRKEYQQIESVPDAIDADYEMMDVETDVIPQEPIPSKKNKQQRSELTKTLEKRPRDVTKK